MKCIANKHLKKCMKWTKKHQGFNHQYQAPPLWEVRNPNSFCYLGKILNKSIGFQYPGDWNDTAPKTNNILWKIMFGRWFFFWKMVPFSRDIRSFSGVYLQSFVPGTLNNILLMDVWLNHHFPSKGLESSNRNNHKNLLVQGSRLLFLRSRRFGLRHVEIRGCPATCHGS